MDNARSGRLIAEARKGKSLTQKALAEKLGISDRAVSKWERGAGFPEVSLLPDLAEALELGIDELISGERREKTEEPKVEIVREVVYIQKRQLGRKLLRSRALSLALVALLIAFAVFVIARWPRERDHEPAEYTHHFLEDDESVLELAVDKHIFCGLVNSMLDAAEPEIDELQSYGVDIDTFAAMDILPGEVNEFALYVWFRESGTVCYEIIDWNRMRGFVADMEGDTEDYRPEPDRISDIAAIDLEAVNRGSRTEYTRFGDWLSAVFEYVFGIDRSSFPQWTPVYRKWW